MTGGTGNGGGQPNGWRYTRAGAIFGSIDFVLGVPTGIAGGGIVAFSPAAAGAGVGMLIAMLAVEIALISVVLAAHTLASSLASPEYVQVLKRATGGLRGFSQPYTAVAIIATVGAIAALLAAIGWPAFDLASRDIGWQAARWVAFAVPAALTCWSIIGATQLVALGAFHLENRVAAADAIAELEARRRRNQ